MLYNNMFDDLFRINKEINKFFGSKDARFYKRYWPETNIYNSEEKYVVVAKLPGLNKDDISISIKDNSLKISGKKQSEKKDNVNYHIQERRFGEFERNFLLNDRVQVENIQAELKNGLLIVDIPKSPEAKPMTISIR